MGDHAPPVPLFSLEQLATQPQASSLLKIIHCSDSKARHKKVISIVVANLARQLTTLAPPVAILQNTISMASLIETQLISATYDDRAHAFIVTAPRAISIFATALRDFGFVYQSVTYRFNGAPYVGKGLASSVNIIYKFQVYPPPGTPEFIPGSFADESTRRIVADAFKAIGLNVTRCDCATTNDAFKIKLPKYYLDATFIDDHRGCDTENLFRYLQPNSSNPEKGVLRITPEAPTIKELKLCPEIGCYRPLHYDRDGTPYCPGNCSKMRTAKRPKIEQPSLGDALAELFPPAE